MYYVYVLLSLNFRKTYTGVTKDIDRRLEEHNQGKVSFSRKFRPYKVFHIEKFESIAEAYAQERFFKSTSGRRVLKKMFEVGLNYK